MLISVITLSYNSLATIKQTINSVLSQDYAKIQYIISDDGTEGFNSAEIEKYIKEHARENIKEVKIIHHEKNIGTIRNIKNALKQSKGEIVFNLSADDVFFDERVISDWVNEFKVSSASIITAKRAVFEDELNEVLRIEPTDFQIERIKNSSPEELFEYLAPSNIVFGCCTARTGKSIEKHDSYSAKYKYIEDYVSNLRLLRKGEKIHFFDRIVVKYRISGISSPSRINREYLKENHLIFKNEALPFVKNKKLAKKAYRNWEKTLRYDNRLKWLNQYKSSHNRMGRIFASGIFNFIWYPALGFKKLAKKVTFNNKRENENEN